MKRTRKRTYAELESALSTTEHDRSILQLGLNASVTEVPDHKATVRYDEWRYTFRAYRLSGPLGGIVVVQSHYLTGTQRDSVTVHYLDNLPSVWTLDAHPIHAAIQAMRTERDRLTRLSA
jgi:hypothetical protein